MQLTFPALSVITQLSKKLGVIFIKERIAKRENSSWIAVKTQTGWIPIHQIDWFIPGARGIYPIPEGRINGTAQIFFFAVRLF